MFFAAAKLYFKLLSVVFVTLVFFSANAQAQKKKTPAAAADKKSQTSKQSAAKNQPNDRKSADKKSADKKSASKKPDDKQALSKEKQTAAKDKNTKDKNAKDKLAKDRLTKDKSAKDKLAVSKDKLVKDKLTKDKLTKEKIISDAKIRQTDLKKQAEEKRQAEIRQAEQAKQREIENARRQAALEEKRRREQAAREARERAIAFERGLHTETIQNIASDDTEGEDLEVRRAAVAALGNKAGMVVVIEPQTGKVLSIVNQDWAIRKSYKPCSTIKLVTAIAGLNENVIDGGSGNITTRSFPMNLNDALAFSNNRYFQVVGANFGNKKMLNYAQMLGLGKPTGINAENETGGRLPFGNNGAKVYSHGEDFEVSPLQLAVLVSAISNGGKIVVPQIPRTKFERANFKLTTRGTVNLPPRDLLGVVPGMIGAATYGTARHGVDSSLGVAGKTGSCIGGGSWLGLFASVAPVASPKLAVVVITRGQAERGKYAAAVAGKIYRALSYRLKEKGDTNFTAQTPTPLIVKPKPKINAKTAALLDEQDGESDEEDAEADNDALSKGKKGGVVIAPYKSPKTEIVQKVEKKIDNSANLFAPVVITFKREKPETTRPRIVSHE